MKHKDYVTIHAGTEVTRKILDNLGSPDDSLKIIHIAGTNGKGSTAEFFTQILIAAGERVGTFTSPAVYDFYDQFRINGVPLPADVAEKYFDEAQKAAKGLNATDFEIQTAGIIHCFNEEGCEWAVIECGMGGLGDATNAINRKELAVITSISLEHTEYLGKTIEEICAQKAGIIKNCPTVLCDLQRSEAEMEFFKNTDAHIADVAIAKDYELSVPDPYQAYNAATAIEGARILGLPEKAIREGIKNAKLSGRIEKFEAGGRTYILDGAHNPNAFEPLINAINFLDCQSEEITVIFGCLKDKDLDGNVCMFTTTGAEKFIAVPCPNPRSLTAEEVKEGLLKYYTAVSIAESVTDALNKANTDAVVVCGSFTLLKEAKKWIDSLTGKRQ